MKNKNQRFRYQAFPDRFAILPSDVYRFGPEELDGAEFSVIRNQKLPNGIEVLAVNAGLLAFDFAGHPDLGGLRVIREDASIAGAIREEVMQNRDHIIAAQVERMRHATFVTACIFGVHAHRTHSSVLDAMLPGLKEIYGYAVLPGGRFGIPSQDTPELALRLQRRQGTPRHIPSDNISAGLELAARLINARTAFHVADPLTLIVMTYQAMILHNRQHAGASIALLALVTEAAIDEAVHAYGFVDGVEARFPEPSGISAFSRKQVKMLGFNGKLQLLAEANLLSPYLASGINDLRIARNALMHDAKDAAPFQSGPALNVARDLLRLITSELDFELNMSWSYRY